MTTNGKRLRRRRGLRNIEIGSLLDTLLVCSIATILLIRLQLWATHYPKLGGGKLHIAHLLWGGLAMLVAIVLLLAFVGRAIHHTAAVIGGIGFGFFIDELGKFITARNDYFFKPAAGLIYLVFILLFLTVRRLEGGREFTSQEYLVGSVELLAEGACGRLTSSRRGLALALLSRADQTHRLVPAVRQALAELECAAEERPSLAARLAHRTEERYFKLVARGASGGWLTAVFAVVAMASLIQAGLGLAKIVSHHENLQVISLAGLLSSLVVAGLVLRGIVQLRGSRLAACVTFEHALLVQIFVGEVFAFLESQFGAALPLLACLALTVTIRYAIRVERHLTLRQELPGLPEPEQVQAAPREPIERLSEWSHVHP